MGTPDMNSQQKHAVADAHQKIVKVIQSLAEPPEDGEVGGFNFNEAIRDLGEAAVGLAAALA